MPQTHPDRLATLANLFGLKPAPVERCRVLELGCGDGGNLIPMAFGLPLSTFVGIDLAERPVAKGRALAEALNLENIAIQQGNILDVSPDLGEFDYIIAHGIYSWVPPAVQDKILAVCKTNLAPNGIAYVSYNTYPGHHLQAIARDLMRYHLHQVAAADPEAQIKHALAVMKFVADAPPERGTYQTFLKQILEEDLLGRAPASLYHDDLAQVNLPVYFHQFVGHAARHGLQFLAEANFVEMQERKFPPRVYDTLRALAKDQIILKEQYLDFLSGRKFRQTLLCHDGAALDRAPKPELVAGFYLSSAATPVSPAPEIRSAAVEEFRGPHEAAMSTGYPLAKAAILELGMAWPKSLRFHELLAKIRLRLGHDGHGTEGTDSDDALELGQILLATHSAGLVELHSYEPNFVVDVSERPVASRLARLQAENEDTVATLRHTGVRVEGALERALLRRLDGTRDRAALVAELAALVESGEIGRDQVGVTSGDAHELRRALREGLERNLARLGRLGLLAA
jgi:methyltransferase-like protein/protein-L-isoaspartate O-methyltransferase